MNFFQHTTAWIKGELVEAALILGFGMVTLLVSFLCWRLGSTPNAKALLIPLLLIGLIYSSIGASMLVSNTNRLTEFKQRFDQGSTAFIQTEKKRVDEFQYGYTISKLVATVCFPLTLLIFWLSRNPTWQGIGLGLACFALAGLVVDYFSQERADTYYKAILAALH